MRAKLFELTKRERQELRQRYRQERERRIADRIQCILLLDAGHSAKEVARILIEQVVNWLDEQGICSAKEVMPYIEQTFQKQYSQSGIQKLLDRLGYSYKKPAIVPAKADPVKQASFVEQYHVLRAGLGNNGKIYFVDASHFLHNAIAGYGWSKRGQRVEFKTNSGRNRFNVLGAYSPDDHALIRVEGTTKCDARRLHFPGNLAEIPLQILEVIATNTKSVHGTGMKACAVPC